MRGLRSGAPAYIFAARFGSRLKETVFSKKKLNKQKRLGHTGERPADAGRSLFTVFPPFCMKRKDKDKARRSSARETAYSLMENRGTVRRPAALPAHVERLAKALGLEVVVEERL